MRGRGKGLTKSVALVAAGAVLGGAVFAVAAKKPPRPAKPAPDPAHSIRDTGVGLPRIGSEGTLGIGEFVPKREQVLLAVGLEAGEELGPIGVWGHGDFAERAGAETVRLATVRGISSLRFQRSGRGSDLQPSADPRVGQPAEEREAQEDR